jgi:hypothetical protein
VSGADDFARLQQAHELLADSDDGGLQTLAGVLEWMIVLYDEKEPSEIRAEARQRLSTDLLAFDALWAAEDEELGDE